MGKTDETQIKNISHQSNFNQAGFTVLELLVVISIISLLASVIITSTVKARARAKDSILYSDVREFKKALELYYQDTGGYPVPMFGRVGSDEPAWQSSFINSLSGYIGSVNIPAGKRLFFGMGPMVVQLTNPNKQICVHSNNGYIMGAEFYDPGESFSNTYSSINIIAGNNPYVFSYAEFMGNVVDPYTGGLCN